MRNRAYEAILANEQHLAKCVYCGKSYAPEMSRQIYCSERCSISSRGRINYIQGLELEGKLRKATGYWGPSEYGAQFHT